MFSRYLMMYDNELLLAIKLPVFSFSFFVLGSVVLPEAAGGFQKFQLTAVNNVFRKIFTVHKVNRQKTSTEINILIINGLHFTQWFQVTKLRRQILGKNLFLEQKNSGWRKTFSRKKYCIGSSKIILNFIHTF